MLLVPRLLQLVPSFMNLQPNSNLQSSKLCWRTPTLTMEASKPVLLKNCLYYKIKLVMFSAREDFSLSPGSAQVKMELASTWVWPGIKRMIDIYEIQSEPLQEIPRNSVRSWFGYWIPTGLFNSHHQEKCFLCCLSVLQSHRFSCFIIVLRTFSVQWDLQG